MSWKSSYRTTRVSTARFVVSSGKCSDRAYTLNFVNAAITRSQARNVSVSVRLQFVVSEDVNAESAPRKHAGAERTQKRRLPKEWGPPFLFFDLRGQ